MEKYTAIVLLISLFIIIISFAVRRLYNHVTVDNIKSVNYVYRRCAHICIVYVLFFIVNQYINKYISLDDFCI